MDFKNEADLKGILTVLRTHIEIRNRSWMKRVHRDCFIGSDAVDFLVENGFADSRKQAVNIGEEMVNKKMIKHVSSSNKQFRDSYLYYRFTEDDHEESLLASTNAGNGSGTYLGQGGCKWSFCPHTAHNSYILNIALAEEIERAVAGASVEARAMAIGKLRARVKEQAESDAPDWILQQSTKVNNVIVSVYERKRPRGDFKNVRITGMVAESPKKFISGVMGFDRRKQWESMFEDGVVVEAIDIGEPPSPIFDDENIKPNNTNNIKDHTQLDTEILTPSLPERKEPLPTNIARATDDLLTFLQTVDLAGIPTGMAIAFLNDPVRQHALAHLRKQMMLSNPQECMLCQNSFETSADIRFCPCCAMVSCSACVSKRVFECVSRQVVSVCVHCFRESSRIRQPPTAVQDSSGHDESVRGKWWRPEELGIVDYSYSSSVVPDSNMENAMSTTHRLDPELLDPQPNALKFIKGEIKPLIPGLLDGLTDEDRMAMSMSLANDSPLSIRITADEGDDEEGDGDGIGRGVNEDDFIHPSTPMKPIATEGFNSMVVPPIEKSPVSQAALTSQKDKTARCKGCGELISRDMEAIEQHMEECQGSNPNRSASVVARSGNMESNQVSSLRFFGGVSRRSDFDKCATRIIYRTARTQSKLFRPREVCAFQDSFVDPDGTCYCYEISVRHCDVRGMSGYVTADVLVLLHIARPIIGGNKNTCQITTISQVDTRTQGPQWLLSFLAEDGSDAIGVPNQDDILRELKSSGNLLNILKTEQQQSNEDDGTVCLDDFDLLAVLGRGGFGKVMQVKHIPTGEIYAMKILKKTELRRRRQVERTQTERTILAAVRHPFIVCLYYAFQNPQKLYMVMDFVQGGDFFTLMRKFKRLPEDWVRIYIAEIGMALQHLHDMDIVYRDLKPENILLCGDGHLKLTDFGLSRFFETRPPAAEDMIGDDDVVTRSFCGTEQYMSPEMLLQQGHNYRMDWWCVGLLMHEMISARHPFHGPSHYDTLRNMVTKQPSIDTRVSKNAASIVRNLLIKNPRARLCCREGIEELKSLPFFENLNWDDLYNKRIEMPYKPELKNTLDLSSFETTFTREAAVDSIGELPAGQSKVKKGVLGFFGIGGASSSNTNEEQSDADAFKGFSFAKDDIENVVCAEKNTTVEEEVAVTTEVIAESNTV